MTFRVAKIIGYNMLKGWNTHEYPEWQWTTNQKANTTYVYQKQDGERTSSSRLNFRRTGPRCPTSLYFHDGGSGRGGGGDDDDE
jgi:hypothetical protein